MKALKKEQLLDQAMVQMKTTAHARARYHLVT
jgi:hypothetical protein